MKRARLLVLSLGLVTAPAGAFNYDYHGVDLDGQPCHIQRGYGPFDYTDPQQTKKNLILVESHHFTTESEMLLKGTQNSLPGDFDYTLRAFPNHHRALYAMIRYATRPLREGQHQEKLFHPPECYLDRAEKFQPKDAKVPLLFGLYLHRLKRYDDAEKQYRRAIALTPKYAEAHYNLGLLLADQERFDEAAIEARKAYKLGYPLLGLKRRLAQAGHPLEP